MNEVVARGEFDGGDRQALDLIAKYATDAATQAMAGAFLDAVLAAAPALIGKYAEVAAIVAVHRIRAAARRLREDRDGAWAELSEGLELMDATVPHPAFAGLLQTLRALPQDDPSAPKLFAVAAACAKRVQTAVLASSQALQRRSALLDLPLASSFPFVVS